MKRSLLPWLVVAAILLLLFPAVAEKFYLQLVTKIMILSIFALSLDLLVGYTGLVSLGHAAYFGFAARRSGQRLADLAACAGGERRGRAAGRRAGAAHLGRVLHHGDAGVRPDGVLLLSRHARRRRVRRDIRQH